MVNTKFQRKYNEFQETQERVYSMFRGGTYKEGGLVPNMRLEEAYIIALRYPKDISDKVTSLSKEIADRITATIYENYTLDNIHTTLGVIGKVTREEDLFEPDKDIIDYLTQLTERVVSAAEAPRIMFNEWGINSNTIIAMGYSNEKFFRIPFEIEDGYQRDLSFELPWGAHITTSRFLENLSPIEVKNSGIIELIEKTDPLGPCFPDKIDVGTYLFEENGIFHLRSSNSVSF